MSRDDIERRMEFIVEQQAQFSVGMGRLEQDLATLGGRVDEVNTSMGKLVEALLMLTNVVETHDGQIERNSTQIEENSAQIAALIEQGKDTDARLNALIAVVDKLITERR